MARSMAHDGRAGGGQEKKAVYATRRPCLLAACLRQHPHQSALSSQPPLPLPPASSPSFTCSPWLLAFSARPSMRELRCRRCCLRLKSALLFMNSRSFRPRRFCTGRSGATLWYVDPIRIITYSHDAQIWRIWPAVVMHTVLAAGASPYVTLFLQVDSPTHSHRFDLAQDRLYVGHPSRPSNRPRYVSLTLIIALPLLTPMKVS
jgi:hypothetical protein